MRTASLVAGAVVSIAALALMAAGGGMLWLDGQKDAQGYVHTGADRFTTPTYALATDKIDLEDADPTSLAGPDRFGKVRVQVTPRTGRPVFVGIARTRDVTRYLRGTAHARVTDVDYRPFDADYRTVPGAGAPARPSTQRFWADSARGAGRQTLTWDVEKGSWSVVVMNDDGSRGVDVAVSAGANLPILTALAWTALGSGVLLGATGVLLILIGVRRREPVA